MTLVGWTVGNREFRSALLTLTILPAARPVPSFKIAEHAFTGDRVIIRNTSSGAKDGGYVWSVDGQPVSRDKDPELQFETVGTKKVTLAANGPTGLSESTSQTIDIRQKIFPCSVEWLQESGNTPNSPTELYFDTVPLELVANGQYSRPNFATFQIITAPRLPTGAGIEVRLSQAPAGFRLVNASDGSVVADNLLVSTPTRLTVEFDRKAVAGDFTAQLRLVAVGAGIQLNGSTNEVTTGVKGSISDGVPWMVALLLAILIIGGIGLMAYKLLKGKAPKFVGPVTVDIEEIQAESAESRAEPQQFTLQDDDVIHLGRDDTIGGAIVYDVGAPHYTIIKTADAVRLADSRRNVAGKLLDENSTVTVQTAQNQKRKLQIRIVSVKTEETYANMA